MFIVNASDMRQTDSIPTLQCHMLRQCQGSLGPDYYLPEFWRGIIELLKGFQALLKSGSRKR